MMEEMKTQGGGIASEDMVEDSVDDDLSCSSRCSPQNHYCVSYISDPRNPLTREVVSSSHNFELSVVHEYTDRRTCIVRAANGAIETVPFFCSPLFRRAASNLAMAV